MWLRVQALLQWSGDLHSEETPLKSRIWNPWKAAITLQLKTCLIRNLSGVPFLFLSYFLTKSLGNVCKGASFRRIFSISSFLQKSLLMPTLLVLSLILLENERLKLVCLNSRFWKIQLKGRNGVIPYGVGTLFYAGKEYG